MARSRLQLCSYLHSSQDCITLLDMSQYRFIVRVLEYVLEPGRLRDHDFRNLLGMYREEAQALLDELVEAERAADGAGTD